MEPFTFSDVQKAAYRAEFAKNANDEQWNLFITECERRQLIPGVHVVMQLRGAQEYSKALQKYVDILKVTLITTINALRLIAQRSGKFEGYGNFEYVYTDADGEPTIKSRIPLGKIPHGVGVEAYRQGWRNPVFYFARFDAYKQEKSGGGLTTMWKQRGEEQTAKCAEAGALRMVAPEECGGLYLAEEFEKDTPVSESPTQDAEKASPAPLPVARVAPVVNQAPGTAQVDKHLGPVPTPDPELKAMLDTRTDAEVIAAIEKRSGDHYEPDAALIKKALDEAEPGTTVTVGPVIPGAPMAGPRGVAKAPSAPKAPGKAVSLPVVSSSTPEAATTLAEKASEPTEAQKPKGTPVPLMVSEEILNDADMPFSKDEYTKFLEGRCAKLVRDRLDKAAGGRSGPMFKDYLVKQSGKAKLQHIGRQTFEKIVAELEAMEPEAAIAKIKEALKA